MSQPPSVRFYSWCGAWEGNVAPETFLLWCTKQGVKANPGVLTHEATLEMNITNFWHYLIFNNHSTYYYNRFRDMVDKLHSEEREEFDFTLCSPLTGYFSFKEWAERTKGWYMQHSYEDLPKYELHRRLMDRYAEGLLSLSFDDLKAFTSLREDRARRVNVVLSELNWSSIGLCDKSH
jgi:hypothetical protein